MQILQSDWLSYSHTISHKSAVAVDHLQKEILDVNEWF